MIYKHGNKNGRTNHPEARRRRLFLALASAEAQVAIDRSNAAIEDRMAAARASARARQMAADQAEDRRLAVEVDHYRRILDRRQLSSPSNARAYGRALQAVRQRRRL